MATNKGAKTLLTKQTVSEIPDGMKHDDTLQMRLSPELKATLDDLRRAESDLPSRSEMIRRLIERAAAAMKRGKR
jgi:hypothetical protein